MARDVQMTSLVLSFCPFSRNDEIVLPQEQTGPVRDRWLWNVSLRRSNTSEGLWLSAPSTA